jgi:GT2 family glycosyltransferase
MENLTTLSIVSHGDADKVDHLLASLNKYEVTKQVQLILTDNLNNSLPDFDPSPWAFLHILRNAHPMGFAQNHNQAFKLIRGRYFVILNPDLIFEQPVFEQLINSLHADQADVIAPKIIDESGTLQDSFRALPSPLELIRRRLPGYKFEAYQPDSAGLIHPDWMAGMFWLMKSDTYRQLGGMDERYRLYLEDVDFCTRARLKGMKLLVDTNLQVRHDAQRSSRRKLYYLFLHMQSAIRFFSSPVYRQALRQNKS